jgi:hypothetical protein
MDLIVIKIDFERKNDFRYFGVFAISNWISYK